MRAFSATPGSPTVFWVSPPRELAEGAEAGYPGVEVAVGHGGSAEGKAPGPGHVYCRGRTRPGNNQEEDIYVAIGLGQRVVDPQTRVNLDYPDGLKLRLVIM